MGGRGGWVGVTTTGVWRGGGQKRSHGEQINAEWITSWIFYFHLFPPKESTRKVKDSSTNISSRSCFRCIGKWLPLSVIWAHLFDLLEYLATSFILCSDVFLAWTVMSRCLLPGRPSSCFTTAQVSVVYCLDAFVSRLHVLAVWVSVCACMFLQCKLLETLWQGHQERLGSSVNVSIAGWEGTRWQTNEGWTNLLNDTTWNATFKIPSGLRPLRTWSVKHDTYLYTCWWSTQACPIGWWHAPPASWPPNPAALVCFGSLPLSPADHSVFISVGRVHLGLWSWGYLPLLYWLSGFVTSRRVRLGLLLISGPLAVKSLQYLGGRLKAHRWCLVIVQILDGHKWRMYC